MKYVLEFEVWNEKYIEIKFNGVLLISVNERDNEYLYEVDSANFGMYGTGDSKNIRVIGKIYNEFQKYQNIKEELLSGWKQ